MPLERVNMHSPHSSSLPNHRQTSDCGVPIDIDPCDDESPDIDIPMSDKATPYQRRPTVYHSDTAHSKQENPDDLAAWQLEIFNRIREYPGDIETYLKEMVPSAAKVPRCPPVGDEFRKVPLGNLEMAMYPPLVDALTALVELFPEEKRPKFYNHEHKIMKFPFQLYEREQHPTKPDIIATIPAIPRVSPLERWRNVAIVFEVKRLRTDDPMIKHTLTHWETLVQLAKSARNIMLSQGRLFAFVVGIYRGAARIFRFDRVGAICSPAFKYQDQPQVLHEFLWRLFHPKLKDCFIVGADPTMELGTTADRERAHEWAEESDPDWAHTAEMRKAVRRITVTNGEQKTTYLAYKLLFVNPRLFSRATLVWEAFDINEVVSDTGTRRRYVLKETWGGLARVSEAQHYEALQVAQGGQDVVGIAKFIHGDDLGKHEEQGKVEEEKKKQKNHVGQVVSPGHLTISGVHHTPTLERLNERSHTRVVLETVGTPLTDFARTKELVMALRDAIEGHWRAYKDGIVHRDISEGNVMIARDSKDGTSRGFIQDFDYSFSWKRFLEKRGWGDELATWEKYCVEHGHEPRSEKDKNRENDSKERTGTFFYMAVEILEAEITHEARHDLESFYWLLVFIVLRHTTHDHPLKAGAFGSLFYHRDLESCASRKMSWLNRTIEKPPVRVIGNEPLTELLERFRILCSRNFTQLNATIARMTHRQVLDIFDDVLAADKVWPDADAACPWVPPINTSYTPDMVESLGHDIMKGTLDHTTADDTRFPRFRSNKPDLQKPDPNYEQSEDEKNARETDDESSEDEADGAPTRTGRDVPHADLAAVVTEEELAVENSDQLPESRSTRGKLAGKEVRDTNLKTNRRSAQSRLGAKDPASRNADRNMAETWPASNADGASARPGQRYNLRSSSRRNLAAATSLDAGNSLPAAGHMKTRSRAQTTSRQRDAGTRDSSVGKRSRAGDDPESTGLDPESHSSKRPRTVSQPRGRKTSKKSGKRP